MIDWVIESLPETWRAAARLAAAPIAWLPALHQTLVTFFLESPSPGAAVAKYVVLLVPAGLALIAIWSTQLALYTLPFRAARTRFASLLLLAWWDAGRVVWMYWLGLARLAALAVGGVVALAVFVARLSAAGVPSLGLAMLAAWCVLEAAVLTHTVRPALGRVLAELAGVDASSPVAAAGLFAALVLLVAGSFACLHALVEAARRRDTGLVSRLLAVGLFVAFFEVTFLYRPLAVALVPGVAGLAPSLALGAGAWLGVRGLTWGLFGRFGAPALLSLVGVPPAAPGPAWWRRPAAEFERDVDWLQARSEPAFELLALPVLQMLAAALNFAMILTATRPVFRLPFDGLRDVTEQRNLETALPVRERA